MMLELKFTKTINIKALYDELVKNGDFTAYDAIDEATLTDEDLTPEVTEQIFTALAQEAHSRIEKNKKVSKG